MSEWDVCIFSFLLTYGSNGPVLQMHLHQRGERASNNVATQGVVFSSISDAVIRHIGNMNWD